MSDIFAAWGVDIAINPSTGDIQVATGWDEIEQYLCRVLLTCPATTLANGEYVPGDYFAEPTFGLGLPRLIGTNPTPQQIQKAQQLALQACFSNPAIQNIPPPVVTIQKQGDFSYYLLIQCTPVGLQPGVLTIPLGV